MAAPFFCRQSSLVISGLLLLNAERCAKDDASLSSRRRRELFGDAATNSFDKAVEESNNTESIFFQQHRLVRYPQFLKADPSFVGKTAIIMQQFIAQQLYCCQSSTHITIPIFFPHHNITINILDVLTSFNFDHLTNILCR